MDCSTPGLPISHYLPEFAQVHTHWVGDAVQPSHPVLPSSPFAFNISNELAICIRWPKYINKSTLPNIYFQLSWGIVDRYKLYIFKARSVMFWYTYILWTVYCCCCCCWVASVVSDSVRPHRWQPTRLRRPWDSPGKNATIKLINVFIMSHRFHDFSVWWQLRSIS